MKLINYILLLGSILFCVNCSTISIESIITNKITIFERFEMEYFSNINIYLYRSSGILKKHRTYYSNRNKIKDSLETYAIFETMPKEIINKNFINTPINLDFIKIFKQLDCTKMFNMEGRTYIEFIYKKKMYFLFRGEIPPKDYYKNISFNPVNKEWNLIVTKYKPR